MYWNGRAFEMTFIIADHRVLDDGHFGVLELRLTLTDKQEESILLVNYRACEHGSQNGSTQKVSIMFKNREDAGKQLSGKLMGYKGQDLVILAVPRGGVPVAAVVSKTLNAPLDVVLSKKIGHPYNREYAIGAVTLNNRILTDATGITKAFIEEETARIRKILKKRYDRYYQDAEPVDLKDKTAVIIDDGVATGNTILVTISLVEEQKPRKIVVGLPVASESALRKIQNAKPDVEIFCVEIPLYFRAVGQFYHDFPQISDEDTIDILNRLRGVTP